jgi:hypothetical protein
MLVHNRPSGDPTPSQADIQMTKAIVDIAKPLGIAVHDHIIVGKNSPATAVGLNIAQSHMLQLPSSFADFRHSCLPNERTLAASIWQTRKSKRLASNLEQQRRRNQPHRAAPIPSQ